MPAYAAEIHAEDLDGGNGFIIHGVEDFDVGRSVSDAGDINGDGFDDFIFGAPRFPVGTPGTEPGHGASVVVFGHAGAWDADTTVFDFDGALGFQIDGRSGGENSGFSVSTAGDVNGDGYADLLIGAPGPTDRGGFGAAYLLFGHAGPFGPLDLEDLTPDQGVYIFNSASSGDHGFSVSQAGDINGDGLGDIIVGAPTDDSGVGAAYVLYGRDGGYPAEIDLETMNRATGFKLHGGDADGAAGFSVSTAGDVNGDGLDDLLVGAPGAFDEADRFVGETFVVFGRRSLFESVIELESLDGQDGFRIGGVSPFDRAGRSVSNLDDINGDGVGDLAIGAPTVGSGAQEGRGEAYVVYGRRGGFGPVLDLGNLDASTGLAVTGFSPSDGGGYAVSNAGDWNGDGFDDLLVGAPDINIVTGAFGPGAAYLVFGGPGLAAEIDIAALDGSNGFRIEGAPGDERTGSTVSTLATSTPTAWPTSPWGPRSWGSLGRATSTSSSARCRAKRCGGSGRPSDRRSTAAPWTTPCRARAAGTY